MAITTFRSWRSVLLASDVGVAAFLPKCGAVTSANHSKRRRLTTDSKTTSSNDNITSSYPRDAWSNTPGSILSKLPRQLHKQPSHPIFILRQLIESHFKGFTSISPDSPIVTVAKNFDDLGFAPDHPGRSLTDSYYLNKEHMLRTHTSAHEVETFANGHDRWLLTADVYRRDEIDASHYPVFHQMEGACVWTPDKLQELPALNAELQKRLAKCSLVIEDESQISEENPYQASHDPATANLIAQNLKLSLNSLIFDLFGPHRSADEQGHPLRIRWIDAFFPFTTPSYEVEVFWKGEWLEILGSGVVMQKTLENADVPEKCGWAFGLGLERIAMILFSIPDIRLFWSTDERFLNQFQPGQVTTFKPYSKYPECYKDVSFWLPSEVEGAKAAGGAIGPKQFHENDFCEIVRDVAGDLVEGVKLIDDFVHPKTGRRSKCYRLNYRSMDRSLSNEEVNRMQALVLARVVKELDLELR